MYRINKIFFLYILILILCLNNIYLLRKEKGG